MPRRCLAVLWFALMTVIAITIVACQEAVNDPVRTAQGLLSGVVGRSHLTRDVLVVIQTASALVLLVGDMGYYGRLGFAPVPPHQIRLPGPVDPAREAELEPLAARARETGCVVTQGLGPRYLHSTGQLHKGGPASGVFLQLTADHPLDVTLPGSAPSFGALIANKQLGATEGVDRDAERWRATYAGQLFLMLAGALFLSFNVAPTEEMALIAYRMTPWHGLALVTVSILALHAFVYSVGFAGQEEGHARGGVATFLHYTLVGYGIAVAASLYVLWTFGRTDGAAVAEIATMAAVLAFPGAIGAAIARLLV